MRVTLLDATSYKGKTYKVGDEIDAPEGVALRLCAMSKAVASTSVKVVAEPEKKAKKEKKKAE